MLKPGDDAPDFEVPDHEGKVHRLGDYRGKSLVLWFYPAANTPGCTAEGCGFRDLKAEYDRKNAAILGASFDTAADNADFAQRYHYNFPLLCDTDRKLGLAYGASPEADAKHAARAGVVIGPDGKVKHYFSKVSAKDFPHEALQLV